MPTPSPPELSLAFINAQLAAAQKKPEVKGSRPRPVVTISRQAGAGGQTVAYELAEYLRARSPKGTPPWTVFEKNIIEKVLEDHDLPRRLAEFMPEDSFPRISDAVEELLGIHPLSWRLVQQTTETILRLAELGHVILVGRGSTVIAGHMPSAFHVRLIGSLEKRVARIAELQKLSRRKALEAVEEQDRARRRYVKKYFHADLDDPLYYHLVLNTDRLSRNEAALIIGDAVLARLE